ncbi:MAG: hypothetical protein AAFY06_16880 [Pseudomonadota bacterium]
MLLALVILGSTAGVLALNGVERTGTWTATHWLFSYEHGFVKRGLVGTLLSPVFDTITIQTVTYLYLGFVVLAAGMLGFLIWRTLLRAATGPTALVLACFLVTSPGALQQWLGDVGRFDVFGLILICLTFMVVRRAGATVGLVAVSICAALAIFIHEGFLFWVAPMGLAFWVWQHSPKRCNLVLATGALVCLVGLTAWVSGTSYSDRFAFDDAKSELQERAEFTVNQRSLMIHYRSFAENISYSSERAWTSDRLLGQVLGAAYLVFMALWLFAGNWRRTAVLLVACVGALGLIPLGHDLARWFAMIACNLLFALLLVVSSDPARLHPPAMPNVALLCLGVIANCVLGPFGVTLVFPNVTQ